MANVGDPVQNGRSELFPDAHFAATACHGMHQHIPAGATMYIYDEGGVGFKTTVLFKSPEEQRDFLLLRFTTNLVVPPPFVTSPVMGGAHYLLMGYPSGPVKSLS
ncbi:unnamed protein product, partial [Mesorhabditis belari]|uniref:Uncharacterized protein n=1 Tax=Mesorhabditis belari TaxID=2138241 RepID=A0AAF3FRT7_9BILA